MRWAALYRRPPIPRGVSALQIRADHAANQARINARYGSALSSSLQLPSVKPIRRRSDELTRSFHVHIHKRISNWDRLRTTSPDWTGRCQLGRPLRHLASRPHLACFPGYAFTPYILTLMAIGELVNDKLP